MCRMVGEVTTIGPDGVTFRLPDPERRHESVRVDLGLGGMVSHPQMEWADGAWQAHVASPTVTRLEYTFEATDRFVDPGNPHVVAGGYHPRSVLELPGYAPPAWLATHAETNREPVTLQIDLGAVHAWLWEAPGVGDEPGPLLIVDDGPAYADEGHLLDYLTHLATRRRDSGGPIRIRALLLAAADRDLWYAANDDYAAALAQILAQARTTWPTSAVVGMGASLGALAMLHAEWRLGLFDGLFLQSGSFFTSETDPQEGGFGRFQPIADFVAEVHSSEPSKPLPPIAMTCGAGEENVHNNKLMAARLQRLGGVGYVETTQAHNFVAWRDALDPGLADLLATVIRRTHPSNGS